MSEREPFEADERRALDAWSAATPPADLAARVLARSNRRQRGRRARWGLAAAAALLGAIGGGALLLGRSASTGGARSGSRQLAARGTVAIGDRALAVAEAGSTLSWRLDRDGAARVEQPRGNVFYRVSPGASFRVTTPVGVVTVLGTCFRVAIVPAAGTAGGGARALVTVHEGRVQAMSAGFGGREVSAGQAAWLDGASAPQLRPATIAPRRALAASPATTRPARAAARTGGPMAGKLSRDLSRLEREVGVLRRALAKAQGKADQTKVFDLKKSDLVAMAQRCELRWDMPSLTIDKAPTVPKKHRERLGLGPAEVASIEDVLAKQHRKVVSSLRKLYVEVTNDRQAARVLSPWSLISEITGKSPRAERKAVFSQLARERAGLATASADERRSAFERMMRLLTALGARLEKEIGARIGPDLARRYRREGGGFGSRSRSSYGCPKSDKRP
jgi:hypothetical protein